MRIPFLYVNRSMVFSINGIFSKSLMGRSSLKSKVNNIISSFFNHFVVLTDGVSSTSLILIVVILSKLGGVTSIKISSSSKLSAGKSVNIKALPWGSSTTVTLVRSIVPVATKFEPPVSPVFTM